MTEERISELRALCAEYERKKAIAEAAGLKDKAADIAADGVGRKALEALPELIAENRALREKVQKLEQQRDWLSQKCEAFCLEGDNEYCSYCPFLEGTACLDIDVNDWITAAEQAAKEAGE